MSERERWIVYPLLFFALGSALRDKLLQRIESKEIFCESLKIVDPQDRTRLLAELGSGKEVSFDPSQAAGRVGVLTIQDSDGKEACQLAKDLRTSRVITNLLLVVDPVNHQPHVIAGTEQVPTMSLGGTGPLKGTGPLGGTGLFGSAGNTITHQGVLLLDNQRIQVRPRTWRRQHSPPPKVPPAKPSAPQGSPSASKSAPSPSSAAKSAGDTSADPPASPAPVRKE